MAAERTKGESISIVVALVAALLPVAWGVFQYHRNSQGAQAKEALAYVERFYGAPISDSVQRIFDFGQQSQDEINKLITNENALNQYIGSEIVKRHLDRDVTLLSNFFDDLRACTCANLCDANVVGQFFVEPAANLYGLVAPYILNERKKTPSFGKGLERLYLLQAVATSEIESAYCSQSPPTH
jgi:hypothetical protein